MWRRDGDSIANALWRVCVGIVLAEVGSVHLLHRLHDSHIFDDAVFCHKTQACIILSKAHSVKRVFCSKQPAESKDPTGNVKVYLLHLGWVTTATLSRQSWDQIRIRQSWDQIRVRQSWDQIRILKGGITQHSPASACFTKH